MHNNMHTCGSMVCTHHNRSHPLSEAQPHGDARTNSAKTGCGEATKMRRMPVWSHDEKAMEQARLPKMRPRTKHINLRYHHFREYVRLEKIKIFAISTPNRSLISSPSRYRRTSSYTSERKHWIAVIICRLDLSLSQP